MFLTFERIHPPYEKKNLDLKIFKKINQPGNFVMFSRMSTVFFLRLDVRYACVIMAVGIFFIII